MSALVAAVIGACGGKTQQAVPADVEIQWPDAGVFVPGVFVPQATAPTPLDAGLVGPDAMPQKPETAL